MGCNWTSEGYIRGKNNLPLMDLADRSLRRREMLATLLFLIVCTDPAQANKTAELAYNIGLKSVTCSSLTDARTLVEQHTFQLILCADDLPDCNLGTSLKVLSSATGGVPVVVLSHLAEWEAYVKALTAGAFDYIAF